MDHAIFLNSDMISLYTDDTNVINLKKIIYYDPRS